MEILQMDPIQFLPFSLMVGNLLLQPKDKDSLEFEICNICTQIWTFSSIAWNPPVGPGG